MKILIKGISSVLFIIVTILTISAFLPKEKTTVNQITIEKPFFFVWAAMTNRFEEPQWRTGLDTVIQLEDRDTDPVWREFFESGDSITWQITTEVSNKLLVRQIVDDPVYEGTMWAINVMSGKTGTVIRIVEEQHVNKPLERLKYINTPHDLDVKLYLTDLINKFTQTEEEDNSFGW